MTAFIELRLGSYAVLHGFDEANREITERVEVDGFHPKLVAVDRIRSISDQAVLIEYAHGRVIYWEYEGRYADLRLRLEAGGLLA